ncbi:FAD-dependent monooxygenase [Streptomyces sp. NPDC091215]|uniref:FAD-dependent monooxygenase n=1 Tax=Streptomyces sp. NPDC091215 TaxID=3155192 RepID=UPI00344520C1
MPTINSALIVGGGIAGLTAATALGRQGISCDVLELHGEPAGAAITIQNRAVDALAELGLFDQFLASGLARAQQDIFRHFDTAGNPIPTAPMPPEPDSGLPQAVVIRRTALARVLREGAEAAGAVVRTGMSITGLTQHADSVTATLTDGSERTYDLVIGADGIRSVTRNMVFGDEVVPQYTGTTMFRWVVDDVPDVGQLGFYHAGTVLNVTARLRDGSIYLATGREYPSKPGRFTPDAARRVIAEHLEAFSAPLLRAMRERLTDDARIIVNDYDWLLAPDPWYRGRVLIIGDAAHATTALLASGGGMAIEDAAVLGQEFGADGTVEEALKRFMKRRFDRARFVVETSIELSDMLMRGAPTAEMNDLRGRALVALKSPY